MAQLAEILGLSPTISKILSVRFMSVIEKSENRKKEARNRMARFFKRQNKLGCFDAES